MEKYELGSPWPRIVLDTSPPSLVAFPQIKGQLVLQVKVFSLLILEPAETFLVIFVLGQLITLSIVICS